MSKCKVVDCGNESTARGWCQKHYMRWVRNGHVDETRPNGWGGKEAHPLYHRWGQLRRARSHAVCEQWLTDFWAFVGDLGEIPSTINKRVRLAPIRESEPMGPLNFQWVHPTTEKGDLVSRAQYMRSWNEKNRDKSWAYALWRYYKKTPEWYNQTLDAQGGVCAICKNPESLVIRGAVQRLAVDHDHATGQVRGLLCKNCNTGIGGLKHDIGLLQSAISYLHQPPSLPGEPS